MIFVKWIYLVSTSGKSFYFLKISSCLPSCGQKTWQISPMKYSHIKPPLRRDLYPYLSRFDQLSAPSPYHPPLWCSLYLSMDPPSLAWPNNNKHTTTACCMWISIFMLSPDGWLDSCLPYRKSVSSSTRHRRTHVQEAHTHTHMQPGCTFAIDTHTQIHELCAHNIRRMCLLYRFYLLACTRWLCVWAYVWYFACFHVA